ncbi:hypothetical protein RUE5091_00497 [Ruegeria denitrificans]|uniref:Uncharacterized protein n=1 Tax=Ruegeria denitrificans TaxID=1715692 RepID=A0A0P1IF28_9RHOB|nr:hypothetical protein [Ruegeria denitrificans]CUJ86679.1 hypothetical protein RUE5091_00497 [Ruegeria denitrificans]
MTPFTFKRLNRTSRAVVIVMCVYAGLIALVILFDAAWWLVGLLSLPTLPALWDIAQGTQAGLTLDRDVIRWFSGKREAEVVLADIDHVRLDTRWDFSVRTSLVLTTGKRIRLPDEATPPHKTFETALQQAGLRVERHHFTVF